MTTGRTAERPRASALARSRMAARTASSAAAPPRRRRGLEQVLLMVGQFVVRDYIAGVAAEAGIDAINDFALGELAFKGCPPVFDALQEGRV